MPWFTDLMLFHCYIHFGFKMMCLIGPPNDPPNNPPDTVQGPVHIHVDPWWQCCHWLNRMHCMWERGWSRCQWGLESTLRGQRWGGEVENTPMSSRSRGREQACWHMDSQQWGLLKTISTPQRLSTTYQRVPQSLLHHPMNSCSDRMNPRALSSMSCTFQSYCHIRWWLTMHRPKHSLCQTSSLYLEPPGP